MLSNILGLLGSFLKVGTIGFGGGSALIPIVEKELVGTRQVLSEEEYLKHTVVANITPGALPVKLAATCGMQLCGALCSFLSALAVAAPGVLGGIFLVYAFSSLGGRAVDYLNHASIGITVFIVFLLCHYVTKTVRSGNFRVNLAICLIAFLLTNGREIREIAELLLTLPPHGLGVSLFNISMIHLMIISFFCIFLFQLAGSTGWRLIGAVLAAGYALLSGDWLKGWAASVPLRLGLAALFVAILVTLHFRGRGHGGAKTRLRLQPGVLPLLFVFPLSSLAPLAVGWIVGGPIDMAACLAFLGNIFLSTITSFGGGEAYVSVADSIFVQSGQIDANMFYNRIVPIVNALPGPILVKIAAAMGLVWGMAGGGAAWGWAMAAACAMLAIGACSSLALLVMNFYDSLSHSVFVLSLKRYILPVICGSLLSTSMAMLYESMKIGAHYHYPPPLTLVAMVLGVGFTFWLQHRYRLHDFVLLAASVVAGLLLIII